MSERGEEVLQTYKELYFKLQQDVKALKLKRHKLDAEQVSMLDFIEGKKKIAQFNINNKIITLSKGDSIRGFEHILLGHYCDACSGWLRPREILNLGRILRDGRPLTSFELNERTNTGYEKTINDDRLRAIVNKDGLIERVLSYFSDRGIRLEMGNLS